MRDQTEPNLLATIRDLPALEMQVPRAVGSGRGLPGAQKVDRAGDYLMQGKEALANAVRRWNKPRVYTARHGLGRGLKQVGGVGLVLPRFLRPPPEYAEFAGREESFLRSLDLSGKTVYDVGAFQGILTMFFAIQAGPEGRVVAFEPVPESYRRILEHVALNRLDNVDVRNIAVGSGPGRLTLTAARGGLGRATGDEEISRRIASAAEETESFSVRVNSLDDEMRQASLLDPDFVKVDVEGMEVDVLRGLRETVARRKPALYIEIHGAISRLNVRTRVRSSRH
jgi:FkbM family methyltransferase